MVVMLRQCCCGCSLKTGTIIIGVLNLIGACIGIGNGVIFAQREPEYRSIGIAAAVFSAIMIIISILLLLGAIKDKPALLTPWIICNIIIMIATIIIYIVWAVRYFKIHDNGTGASYIVSCIIYALLETYFILVVYSLYREMKGTA